MPGDCGRALDVLRWLQAINVEGRINTEAAVKHADAADRNHGLHVLNLLAGEGWVTFPGLSAQQIEITETGRNELMYRDNWEAAAPAGAPALSGRGLLLATSPGLLADVLLQRIYRASDGDPARLVGCPSPDHELSPYTVMTVLWRRLVRDELVRVTRLPPAPDLPDVALTPKGCDHVREARELLADRAARSRLIRRNLLSWLYDRREDPAPGRIAEFSADSRSAYRGLFFEPACITDAAHSLHAQGLAVVTGRGGRLAARVTQAGIDCVERGADVAECYGEIVNPRGPAASFCGVLAGVGWAAVAALGALSKEPASNPWFILSVVVSVAATVLFILAGGLDLLRWFGQGIRGLWRAGRGRWPYRARRTD